MSSEPNVSSLVDLVSYQDDAVVSKTLIKKETGTVTLFAFGQGQGLSEHTAPFDAMVNVLDGQAEALISGKPYIVKKGEMIILPAGEPHAINAVTKFKMMLIMVRS